MVEAMKKERPILFSAPMVKAILEGRKTMTRRVIKLATDSESYAKQLQWERDNIHPFDRGTTNAILAQCPYGAKGSMLWVRETFHYCGASDQRLLPAYKADHHGLEYGQWSPSIHMPRWASRITLRITSIRVERIQDITEQDAIAEGIPLSCGSVTGQRYYEAWSKSKKCVSNLSAKAVFPTLWDSINEKRGYGWDINPWVWVIGFERVAP